MTMAVWPFNKERPTVVHAPDPETRALGRRTDALKKQVEALGVETRAVAREAEHIRDNNHFGAALLASMQLRGDKS